jgi:hypothetical protein
MTEATLEGIEDKDGIQRRAHILAALTRFKQICNHPESFTPSARTPLRPLGQARPDAGASRRARRRGPAGADLHAVRGDGPHPPARPRARFELDAGFYHGGLNAAKREAMVDAFHARMARRCSSSR